MVFDVDMFGSFCGHVVGGHVDTGFIILPKEDRYRTRVIRIRNSDPNKIYAIIILIYLRYFVFI